MVLILRVALIALNILFLLPIRAQLLFSETHLNTGTIESAYQLQSVITVTNTGQKTAYLMRADTDPEVTVKSISKRLGPGDTTSVFLTYTPKKDGKFSTTIELVCSDKTTPYLVHWSGQLKHWKADDRTACYYFRRNTTSTEIKNEPLLVQAPVNPKDNSNRIPDPNKTELPPPVSVSAPVRKEDTSLAPHEELPLLQYKPNNILFLVDVSSSMKDSLKLPLVKIALHKLVDALRDVDYISFMTYADSVTVLAEHLQGQQKEQLKTIIGSIKAKGLTKGNKAILAGTDLVVKHYLPEGNNQIILITDGQFRMTDEDYKKWEQKTLQHTVIISTVGFGDEKNSIRNLKTIAQKGSGAFIHVKSRKACEDVLLEEIKERSKRKFK